MLAQAEWLRLRAPAMGKQTNAPTCQEVNLDRTSNLNLSTQTQDQGIWEWYARGQSKGSNRWAILQGEHSLRRFESCPFHKRPGGLVYKGNAPAPRK